MATTHLTKEWLAKLQEELYMLRNTKLPAVLERLKEAIAQGDISENAEYDTAMGEKELVEARIAEIEHTLQDVEIIEHSDTAEIRYGSTVVVEDDKGVVATWRVVGSGEIDILGGTVSFESPLGHALRGKKAGDTIQVRAPQKKYSAKILEVK
jgi:transcription elongation factor GreA